MSRIFFFFIFAALFSGCGYHFENQDERLSLSIPYVRGDNEGQLTNELIRQFAYSGGYDYVKDGGNLLLKVVVIGDGTEKIGYRYDRNEFTGELQTNLLPTENRRTITAEVTLINSPTGEILIGPHLVEASSDYDYTDVNSIQDLAFTTPSGKLETVLNFSLGQVDSVEGAQDDAIEPIYRNLAKKIITAILNYSSSLLTR